MKIRAGFVSNSSSTSFCIYGFSGDIDDINKMLLKSGLKNDEGEPIDDIYKITSKHNIDIYEHPHCDMAYVGFDVTEIPDDMVVSVWKKEKSEELKRIFGEDVKCDFVEDGWFDG